MAGAKALADAVVPRLCARGAQEDDAEKIVQIVGGYSKQREAKRFVYLFGGYMGDDSSQYAKACHRYNLPSHTWTTMAPMPTHRVHAAAVSLNDRIYVLGGLNTSNALSSMDVYYADKDTWERKTLPTMNQARHSFAAVAFEGKIYVFGGANRRFEPLSSAECYDSKKRTWSTLPEMKTKRMGARAVVAQNEIMVLGGQTSHSGKSVLKTVDVYNPIKRVWTDGEPMLNARSDFGCCIDEKAIIVCGGDHGNQYLTSTEAYEFEGRHWIELGELKTPRSAFAPFLSGRKLYALGGYAAGRLSSVEVLDIEKKKWSDVPDLPAERSGHCCASIVVR